MKAFHTIAVPHKDILEGRLSMDVFAADLWRVRQGQGLDEYKDAATFFSKTYMTAGLEDLLTVVEKRLGGAGGDPVIQIQTPFGGGKTHALIAMYHQAAEWGANVVVIVGEKLKTGGSAADFDTLWGVLATQLTGETRFLRENGFLTPVPPGGEQVSQLLENHRPVLILMDELISYLNVADSVYVGKTTLTALTLTFLQTLSNVASEMMGVSFVLTATPSNPYNKTPRGAEIVSQLQDIVGRREIVKSPVRDDEIVEVIRKRLFSAIDEAGVKEVVAQFSSYAEKEGILPADVEPSAHRRRFRASYPFMPEVVDVLYQRWGSFPKFQRTRGVLRLLSLVIHSLKDADKPYISLADFDLANQEIRQELLKHIGSEYNGIIAADITAAEAGAKKANASLGAAYQWLKLGTRTATTIFLYSFSGGPERGATLGELKRAATTLNNPASVVAEAAEQFKNRLFYLQSAGDKYFFTTEPNINLILLTKMDNVKDEDLVQTEQELLTGSIGGGRLKVYIWQEDSRGIPDSTELKLVVLRRGDADVMQRILKKKGETKRVNLNTLFFLYPLESERAGFVNLVKRRIAYARILQDKTLRLSKEQRDEANKELAKLKKDLRDAIRKLYRVVAVPARTGFKEIDLGVPTYGEKKKLDQEVYGKLISDGEILEKIEPIVIKEKYLSGKEYVLTERLYPASLQTPGEPRLLDRNVLQHSIAEGVHKGLFGLGELEDNVPRCRYFKEMITVALYGSEIIISENLAKAQQEAEQPPEPEPRFLGENGVLEPPQPQPKLIGEDKEGVDTTPTPSEARHQLQLRFRVPKGKVSGIMGVMNLLQSKFDVLEVQLNVREGEISEQDYEDKIEEAFRQLGIEWEEE